MTIFTLKNNKWNVFKRVSCWHVLIIQVAVDVFNFPALASLSFSFHSNLYLYVMGPIIGTIVHKLISWTLVLEIDNYEKKMCLTL